MMKQWAPWENHLLGIGSSLKKKSTLNSDRRQISMRFDKISRNISNIGIGSSLKKINIEFWSTTNFDAIWQDFS